MDIVGLIEGVYGSIEQILTLANDIKALYDAIKGNPETAQNLFSAYERILSNLRGFQKHDLDTLDRFPSHHAKILTDTIQEPDQFTSSTSKMLERKLRMLNSRSFKARAHQIIYAMKNDAKFTELESEDLSAQETIVRISNTLGNAAISENNTVTIVNERTAVILERLPTNATSSVKDAFLASNTTRSNQENIVMDFESKRGDSTPLTCEGKLKEKLLGKSEGETIGNS